MLPFHKKRHHTFNFSPLDNAGKNIKTAVKNGLLSNQRYRGQAMGTLKHLGKMREAASVSLICALLSSFCALSPETLGREEPKKKENLSILHKKCT